MAQSRSRDVWAISLSACFADLGYQSVLAAFPLFLVVVLRQSVWEFGVASALAYGGGALFSYLGGRLGGKIGHRRLAIIGNALIPILSLAALVHSPAAAIGLLTGGWWARNLRSPSRRVMLVEAVPDETARARAFGFLHALDVGGGAAAGLYVLAAVLAHVEFRWMILGTAFPLLISTLLLSRARTGMIGRRPKTDSPNGTTVEATGAEQAIPQRHAARRALLLAAALYGFASYSTGFPVLTLAEGSHRLAYGVAAFVVFQLVSAISGYLLGARLGGDVSFQLAGLGLAGYLTAGLGAVMLAAGYATHAGVLELLSGVAVLGLALGVIETLEPSLMAVFRTGSAAGRGFGALSAARSIGVFVANLALGLLYSLGPSWSYAYAALVAGIASGAVLHAVFPARLASVRQLG